MEAGRVMFAGGDAPLSLQAWAEARGMVCDVTRAGAAGLEHFLAHPATLVIAVIHMETMGDLAALARLRELPTGRDVPLIVLSRPSEVERFARFTEQLKPLAVLAEPLDINRLSELHKVDVRNDQGVRSPDATIAEVQVRPRSQRRTATQAPEGIRPSRGPQPPGEPDSEVPAARRARAPIADEVVGSRRPTRPSEAPAPTPRQQPPTPEPPAATSARGARSSAPPAPTAMTTDELKARMRDLGKQNNFERMGITLSSTQSDVDSAFEGLTARLQPERYRDRSALTMAEGLMRAIRQAYDTLNSPHKRSQYVARLSSMLTKTAEPTATARHSALSDLLAEAERASEAALIQPAAPRAAAPSSVVAPPEAPSVVDVPAAIVQSAQASPPEPAAPAIASEPTWSPDATSSPRAPNAQTAAAVEVPSVQEAIAALTSSADSPVSLTPPLGADSSGEKGDVPSFDDVDAIFGGDLDWSEALPMVPADDAPAAASDKPLPGGSGRDPQQFAPAPAAVEPDASAPVIPNRKDRLAPKPLDRARKTPQEALEAGPRDWILEARYLLFTGDYTRALPLLDACLAAEPNMRRYNYYRGIALGRSHAENGRFAEARRALDDAVRHAGSGQTEAAQALTELAQLERRRA